VSSAAATSPGRVRDPGQHPPVPNHRAGANRVRGRGRADRQRSRARPLVRRDTRTVPLSQGHPAEARRPDRTPSAHRRAATRQPGPTPSARRARAPCPPDPSPSGRRPVAPRRPEETPSERPLAPDPVLNRAGRTRSAPRPAAVRPAPGPLRANPGGAPRPAPSPPPAARPGRRRRGQGRPPARRDRPEPGRPRAASLGRERPRHIPEPGARLLVVQPEPLAPSPRNASGPLRHNRPEEVPVPPVRTARSADPLRECRAPAPPAAG
jgi:hypothetical protein